LNYVLASFRANDLKKKTNKQTKKPTNECREKMGEKSKLFKKIERESNHIRRLSFCVVVQHPN